MYHQYSGRAAFTSTLIFLFLFLIVSITGLSNPDTDGDRIPDGLETTNKMVPGKSNMYLFDTDGDGLWDGEEDTNLDGVRDPRETQTDFRDSDGDRYEDGLEVLILRTDPLDMNDPKDPFSDRDGDGLPDDLDPNSSEIDTDGDRISDGFEAVVINLEAADNFQLKPPLGNVNLEGDVDNADSQLILNFFGGIISESLRNIGWGDVDRNTIVDNADSQWVLNYFGRIRRTLPAGISEAPISTPTPTSTSTNTPSFSPTNTRTPSNTRTNTPIHTRTNTPTDTPRNTATNTVTNTFTSSPTNTPRNTATNTRTNTRTSTRTNTPTRTPSLTPTPACGTPPPPISPYPPFGALNVSQYTDLNWNWQVLLPEYGGKVLWDTTHGVYLGYSPANKFSTLTGILQAKGFTIVTSSAGVDNLDLSQYSGIVVCAGSAYSTAYTASEINAIVNFVNAGGGLLVMGDTADFPNHVSAVSQPFGIATGVESLAPSDLIFGIGHAHPILNQVFSVHYRVAGALSVSLPAETLEWAYDQYGASKKVLALAYPGSGRVVVTGDMNFCENDYIGNADNQRLAENIFHWALTSCPISYDVYLSRNGADPVLTCENLPVFRCFPSLDTGTYYEWRVISKNVAGQTNGPLWWFMTVGNTPTPTRTGTNTNTRTHTATRTPTRTFTNTPTPIEGNIYGYIRDTGGNGISQAVVEVYPSGKTHTTGTSGYYFIGNLFPGTYWVHAKRDGYDIGRAQATVTSNTNVLCNQNLTAGGNIYLRAFSVEDFVDGNNDLNHTHESAGGFLSDRPGYYYASGHFKDSSVTRALFYDYRETVSGMDSDNTTGVDRCTLAWLSSHGGSDYLNYWGCMGDTLGSAGTWSMLLGTNRPDHLAGMCRYFFGDTCDSLGHNAEVVSGMWYQAVDGIRMIFGYATISADNPNYGKYFWDEWNHVGATNQMAYLDASWRINDSQMPVVLAYGPTLEEARSRRNNDQYFHTMYSSNEEWAWGAYTPSKRAILPDVPSLSERRSLTGVERGMRVTYKPFMLDEAYIEQAKSTFGLGEPQDTKETDANLGLEFEEGYLNISRASGALDYRRRRTERPGEFICTAKREERILDAQKAIRTLELAEEGTYAFEGTAEMIHGEGHKGETTRQYRAATIVIFRRLVGGVPTAGPGGRIELTFDDAGLQRVRKIWREIESIEPGTEGRETFRLEDTETTILAENPGTTIVRSELGLLAQDQIVPQAESKMGYRITLQPLEPGQKLRLVEREIE